MNPKSLITLMLTPAIRLHAEKTHSYVECGKLKEAEAEIDDLIAVATELSRRIRKCFDDEEMK